MFTHIYLDIPTAELQDLRVLHNHVWSCLTKICQNPKTVILPALGFINIKWIQELRQWKWQSKESEHNEYQNFLRQEGLNLTVDNHKLRHYYPFFHPQLQAATLKFLKMLIVGLITHRNQNKNLCIAQQVWSICCFV